MMFLCFTNSFLAGFKFSQIDAVVHSGKVIAGADVNFMIAIRLFIIICIIQLFHSVIFNFEKQKYISLTSFFYGKP